MEESLYFWAEETEHSLSEGENSLVEFRGNLKKINLHFRQSTKHKTFSWKLHWGAHLDNDSEPKADYYSEDQSTAFIYRAQTHTYEFHETWLNVLTLS